MAQEFFNLTLIKDSTNFKMWTIARSASASFKLMSDIQVYQRRVYQYRSTENELRSVTATRF